jgi:hypothetical protein
MLFLSTLVPQTHGLASAQSATDGQQDKIKRSQDEKKNLPSFEDDQSAICLSYRRQAKVLAAAVETYSRRLGACTTSSTDFATDCSADFARVRQSYSQYEIAIGSVRSYCR